ncbi:MAG TPA: thioredoxin family protein [Hanamia sp.]|jgi:thioredoxin-related protein|nr:thioredoxin family protein [Hanamia sp.]
MKGFKLLIAALILISSNGNAQTEIQSADTVIKEAKSEAANSVKNIFVIFHASWCIWCHTMDAAMNDESIKSFFDKNYIIKHLTVDERGEKEKLNNPRANELRIKYGGADQGIPYWFILDKNGKLLADSRLHSDDGSITGSNVGCPAKEEEVNYFVKVLKKTSHLSAHQLDLIRIRFLKNNE